jgi:hypothetical protein
LPADLRYGFVIVTRRAKELATIAPVSSEPKRSRRSSGKGRPVVVGFAFLAAIGLALVSVGPYSSLKASADRAPHVVDRFAGQPVQALDTTDATPAASIARDSFTVTAPPPPKPSPTPTPSSTGSSDSDSDSDSGAPAVGTPDPGSAQAYALTALGGDQTQFACLVALWNKESHWNVYAYNASSGAYGIPQALPGSKMASAGPDWQDNAQTQVDWGLGYIDGRYGNPCGAWSHSESTGWY